MIKNNGIEVEHFSFYVLDYFNIFNLYLLCVQIKNSNLSHFRYLLFLTLVEA